MTAGELGEIWSKKARTPGQKAVEHHLNAAATAELKYQEEQSGGLTRLAGKQSSQPTSGGKDRRSSELKAIGSSMTTSVVTRKRLAELASRSKT